MSTKKGMIRRTSRRAYTGLKKRRRGASPAYKKLEARKMALESRYRKLREASKDKGGPVAAALCTTSGGAIAGAVSTTQIATIAGVPTPLLIGVVGTTWGIYSKNKFASQISCISAGMLAKFAGDWAEQALETGVYSPLAVVAGE